MGACTCTKIVVVLIVTETAMSGTCVIDPPFVLACVFLLVCIIWILSHWCSCMRLIKAMGLQTINGIVSTVNCGASCGNGAARDRYAAAAQRMLRAD